MIITKKREYFENHDLSIKMPAILTLQIWDNDTLTPDDFLGTLNLNLSHLKRPTSTPDKCVLSKKETFYENLFAITDGGLRGWFPMRGKSEENDSIKMTGKLEIELQVLTFEKANVDPAGKGREGPQKLSPPEYV